MLTTTPFGLSFGIGCWRLDELYRAANVGGTSGQQQGGQGKECFYVHGLSPVDHQQVN